MRVLFVHNQYRERGGEDISFYSERDLLIRMGLFVKIYTRNNWEINELSFKGRYNLIRDTFWSSKTYTDISNILTDFHPDIVHIHNFFPLISPSVFYACKRASVPAVLSVHNYRLICPNALFSRSGHSCEDCMGKLFPYPGILHKCYRDSRAQSFPVASMLAYHRWKHTWDQEVDRFIALSKFAAGKLIEGGFAPQKISIKPNFLVDPGEENDRGDYAVCVGRLTAEKGIKTLIKALQQLPGIPIKIVGTGPLMKEILSQIISHPNIELLGHLSYEETMKLIRRAKVLIFPTELYETFGRVIIEAYACRVPVIASRIGAVEELVIDGETGLLFTPGDSEELRQKLDWLWKRPREITRMGTRARKEFEEKYTPEANYKQLMGIYQQVLGGSR